MAEWNMEAGAMIQAPKSGFQLILSDVELISD